MSFLSMRFLSLLIVNVLLVASPLAADSIDNATLEDRVEKGPYEEPYNEAAYHLLIREYLLKGDYYEARKITLKLKEIHPDSSVVAVVTSFLEARNPDMRGFIPYEEQQRIENDLSEAEQIDTDSWQTLDREEDMKRSPHERAKAFRRLQLERVDELMPVHCKEIPVPDKETKKLIQDYIEVREVRGISELLELFPHSLLQSPPKREIYHEYVYHLFVNGQFVKASEVNERALKAYPEDPIFRFFKEDLARLIELQVIDEVRVQFQRSNYVHTILKAKYISCMRSNTWKDIKIDYRGTLALYTIGPDSSEAEVQHFLHVFKNNGCRDPGSFSLKYE